jgi:glycosyltransferase involved in cell wall biosynthesis
VADFEFFDRFGHMFRQLGLGLYEEGWRVSLLTDDAEAVADLEGTPIEARGVGGLSGWRTWRLGTYLASQFSPPPALVHVWGTACLRPLAEWTQRYGIPLLIHLISVADLDRLRRRGMRSNQHGAAACLRFSTALQQRWPLVGESVHVVTPGLLIPDLSERSATSEHTLGVVWTGRFDQHSGLDVLIEAIGQLRRRDHDVHVVLIGIGPSGRSIWQDARRHGVADCVSLIDEPLLWPGAVSGADVCVVPACQTELGLAPLVMMALGRIVIASRDQLAEWFVEDETAWQFTPGSAVELAYHLSRAAEGHPAALTLAGSAASYVRAHHSITRLITQLAQIYEALTRAHAAINEGPESAPMGGPVS